MFSVITNIWNKKTKAPTLIELFTVTEKLKKVFFFLTIRDVRCVPCHPWCTHRTSLVVKKTFFGFPVAVNNSIKVGPLVSVTDVCNHGEHYEMPCILIQFLIWWQTDQKKTAISNLAVVFHMQTILFPLYTRNLEITLQYVWLATQWGIQMQYLLKKIWCILKKRYCNNEAFREPHVNHISYIYS